MTVVRKRQPDKRLGKLIRTPGGRTVRDIEADVGERLESLREACRDSLLGKVDEIVRLTGQLDQPRTDEELRTLYLLANDIVGLSGAACADEVGEASLSLCRLIDAFRNGKAWNGASVQVHVQSMVFLAQADPALVSELGRTTIEGLSSVVQKALR